MINLIYFGWKQTILYNFGVRLWVIFNPYNIHMNEHFFSRISSIEPEQTFGDDDEYDA